MRARVEKVDVLGWNKSLGLRCWVVIRSIIVPIFNVNVILVQVLGILYGVFNDFSYFNAAF